MTIKLDNGRPYLRQWDKGQRLMLQGIPAGAQVDFAHCHDGEAVSVLAYDEGGIIYADIPNVLLQEDKHIHAYVYVTDGDRGETTCHDSIRVVARPRPSDYVYEETEALTWHALDERIKALEDGGGGSISVVPEGDALIITTSMDVTTDGDAIIIGGA